MAALSPAPMPMPRWRVWYLATRPWSLSISIVPILLASALAWHDGEVSLLFAVLMLLTSVLTHIACNLTNDYFDHESGVDAIQNEGQGRMLQDGHLTNSDLRNGMIVTFALAAVFGAPVIVRLGWLGVIFALVGAGMAFLYTGGPWPLAYNRMGEIGVFVAMGLVMVGGAYYVHTGEITRTAALLAVNIGLYAAAILHANNMRDTIVDRSHRKHTLANSFVWQWGVREYAVLMVAPLVITVAIVAIEPSLWPLLATAFVVPGTLRALRMMNRATEGTLTSAIVGMSARVHKHYAVSASIALAITALVRQL